MVSSFAQLVYENCKKIPIGKVTTYGKLAEAIGKPKSARAVGTALSKNPSPITIPCHRVVNSDGYVGKYFGKIDNKKIKLLESEGIQVENGRIVDLPDFMYLFI